MVDIFHPDISPLTEVVLEDVEPAMSIGNLEPPTRVRLKNISAARRRRFVPAGAPEVLRIPLIAR